MLGRAARRAGRGSCRPPTATAAAPAAAVAEPSATGRTARSGRCSRRRRGRAAAARAARRPALGRRRVARAARPSAAAAAARAAPARRSRSAPAALPQPLSAGLEAAARDGLVVDLRSARWRRRSSTRCSARRPRRRRAPSSTASAAATRSTCSSSRAPARGPARRHGPASRRRGRGAGRRGRRARPGDRRAGEPARRLAQAAAVAGEPVELGLAAAVAELDEPAALAALDELSRRALLRATGVPRHYRFRHPIVRRAVYESAGEGWRLAAHARAAAALEAAGGSPRRARTTSSAARRRATRTRSRCWSTPATARRRARRPAPSAGTAPRCGSCPQRPDQAQRRLELLIPLATSPRRGRAARAGARHAAGDAAAAAARAVDVRVRLVAACATLENLLGRHRAAHDRLLGALASCRSTAAPPAARSRSSSPPTRCSTPTSARWRVGRGGPRDRARLGRRAMTAVAAALLCFARYGDGDLEAAAPPRAEAAAALDPLPTRGGGAARGALLPRLRRVLLRALRRGDPAPAPRHRVARATGQGQLVVPMLVGLAHALEVRGRLRDALDTAEAAVEAARLAGQPRSSRRGRSWPRAGPPR